MFKKLTFTRIMALLKFLIMKFSQSVKITGLIYIGPRVEIKCKKRGKIKLDSRVYLKKDIELFSEGNLEIGKNVFINNFSYIVCLNKITIEENVMIGERVSIRDHDHNYEDIDIDTYKQDYSTAPILIKENCWIGCNAVILKGVTLGKHSVVAANSVVNKDVPDFTVVAGIPAKIVKQWNPNLQKWVRNK